MAHAEIPGSELEELRARVLLLERENAALQQPRRRSRTRSIAAGAVLVLAVLMAPIAAVGTWARLELVDTERFVATFAPLAQDPDVQDLVADEVTAAIDEKVDVDAVVGDLFDGIRTLDLPPRAESALTLLQGPAASGLSSLIDRVVRQVVASPQFADIWEQSLRVAHERATAILEGEPGTALQLGEDGVLSLDVGIVIDRVQAVLVENGVGIADLIPDVDRTIPIVQSDSLASVRVLYQVAAVAGFWLPWVVLGLVAAGVLLARDRPRAMRRTAAGLTVVFLVVAGAISVGRFFFVGAVSPSVMSAAAAQSVFDQVTAVLSSTMIALAFAAVLIGIWAWLAGSGRSASAVRRAADDAFGWVRTAGERHGLSTGRFGRSVHRYRGAILIVGMTVALLALVATRPVTAGAVLAAAVGLAVLALLVGLLERPEEDEEEIAHGSTSETATTSERAAVTPPG
ncbi:hypothetical protein [Microbacterium sp. BLY]|uniref:hypothetical protein n=1 Tax=Microbacterium sp. BLY TaxID=2823280 RepID=UPI001B341CA6|nr:hypothetical protein [Microbacterium sp. BLY]MBP3978061.1 hypothetical protein [Microbacterium sp. BLY]